LGRSALLANIRLGWTATNALGYNDVILITSVKRFIVKTRVTLTKKRRQQRKETTLVGT
jgi:hypothetical protein